MSDYECAECGDRGGDLRRYWVATPRGARVVRYLHAGRCYRSWYDHYRKWFAEQLRAERNGHGGEIEAQRKTR